MPRANKLTKSKARRKKDRTPPAELREFIDALAELLADDYMRRAAEKKRGVKNEH